MHGFLAGIDHHIQKGENREDLSESDPLKLELSKQDGHRLMEKSTWDLHTMKYYSARRKRNLHHLEESRCTLKPQC